MSALIVPPPDNPADALWDPRHEQFCQLVANGMNEVAAWRHVRADRRAPADSTVAAGGSQLLKRPEVFARISHLIKERLAVEGVTPQRTRREIARIAHADPRKLAHPDGRLKGLHEIDDDTAAAISSVTFVTRMRGRGDAAEPILETKYKFHSKNEALNLQARAFKIVGDTGNEVITSIADALADRLNAAKRRQTGPVEDAQIVEPRQVVYEPLESVEEVDEDDLW